MPDIVSPEVRSRMMSGIRGKNTRNEIAVRKLLHSKGFRYLLHDGRLPGKPDLVFPKYHAVILLNGCFWHGHGCHLFKLPGTRREFWENKIQGNINRDAANRLALQKLGWRVLTIWECAVRGKASMTFAEVADHAALWLISGEPDTEIRAVE